MSVNTCHRVVLTDMNAFIAPLERAVLNLAHGETDAEIKDSQRDRAVKGRPCRRQSRNQDPHSPCSCWDRVPKPGAPSPPPQPPPSLKLAQDESGERGRWGPHTGPLHLCAQGQRSWSLPQTASPPRPHLPFLLPTRGSWSLAASEDRHLTALGSCGFWACLQDQRPIPTPPRASSPNEGSARAGIMRGLLLQGKPGRLPRPS